MYGTHLGGVAGGVEVLHGVSRMGASPTPSAGVAMAFRESLKSQGFAATLGNAKVPLGVTVATEPERDSQILASKTKTSEPRDTEPLSGTGMSLGSPVISKGINGKPPGTSEIKIVSKIPAAESPSVGEGFGVPVLATPADGAALVPSTGKVPEAGESAEAEVRPALVNPRLQETTKIAAHPVLANGPRAEVEKISGAEPVKRAANAVKAGQVATDDPPAALPAPVSVVAVPPENFGLSAVTAAVSPAQRATEAPGVLAPMKTSAAPGAEIKPLRARVAGEAAKSTLGGLGSQVEALAESAKAVSISPVSTNPHAMADLGLKPVSGTAFASALVVASPDVSQTPPPAALGREVATVHHRIDGDRGADVHEASNDGFGDRGAAPRTLVATPNVLEVGITGGAHGWLRVRAEMGHTGEVTASLVASNAGSAEALHRELGAMSAYLKSESVSVSSLAVSASERSAATQSSGPTHSNMAGDGSQGQGQGERAHAKGLRAGTNGLPDDGGWDGAVSPLFSGGSAPGTMSAGSSGGWVNVTV